MKIVGIVIYFSSLYHSSTVKLDVVFDCIYLIFVFLGLYIKLDNIWIYEAKKLRANFRNLIQA